MLRPVTKPELCVRGAWGLSGVMGAEHRVPRTGSRGSRTELMDALPRRLAERVAELVPGSTVESWVAIGRDSSGDETLKGFGYARVVKVVLRRPDGQQAALVFHLANADDFGHDRRADRAANQVLAFDTFNDVPRHVRALDVGAVGADGRLVSLTGTGEFYLVTEWAEGELYAGDLRRLATGPCTGLDLARLDGLTRAVLDVHRLPGTHPAAYPRALRDLVGSGEGIAGIVDGFGDGAPGAPRARLDAIERRCLGWRQRLKTQTGRLRRTHGDFHPFNLLFAQASAEPRLLDASRGSVGDPADDVTCLALNFVFFGLGHESTSGALRALWRRWWDGYLREGDAGVLDTAAPFFAWRALVLTNPAWYPHLTGEERHRLLSFAERALDAPRFDPRWGEAAMDVAPLRVEAPAPGVVVWLTGLPSSGKSWLARRTAEVLGPGRCVVLDGDEVRASLVPTPGYDEAGREAFYGTLARMAALLARQGQVVLVPATAHRQKFRDDARAQAPRFLEVYVDTPLAECRRRDVKGLYAANPGALPGVGETFEAPLQPDLVVRPGDERPEHTLAGLAQT